MLRTLGRFALVVGLGGLLGLSGCSGKSSIKSGFILYSGDLQQTPGSGGWYVYFSPSHPVAGYTKFTVSPLIVQFTPQRPKPVSMQDLDNAEKAYRAALAAALTKGGRFQQVSAPGDRVLLLRGAVTDLCQRDPKGPVGRATMELEAIDSVTRKRVFAVIDPMLGTKTGVGEYNDPREVFQKFAQQLRAQIDAAPTATTR